jgi:NAD+ kinase
MTIQHAVVLAHPLRPSSYSVATDIRDAFVARGIKATAFDRWTSENVESTVAQSDVVIAIGGDGAMLRAARVCAALNVPILGVNMGYLGFLAEVNNADEVLPAIERLLAGDYWIETRLMLRADVHTLTGETGLSGEALNDIVISGNAVGRMTHLEAHIDGHWTTTYNADALVVATATGSTAYALSCGGPILPPELRNILIVPAAPHLSMARPIVLSEGAQVDVLPTANNRNPVLVHADGVTLGDIRPGERVRIRASEHVTRFIRLRERNYFYRSLLDRLEPRLPTGG